MFIEVKNQRKSKIYIYHCKNNPSIILFNCSRTKMIDLNESNSIKNQP